MNLRFTFLMIGCAAVLLADSNKKSRDLAGRPAGEAVPVIVQYRNQPTAADLKFLTAKGGRIHKIHTVVRSVSVTLPAAALDDVAAGTAVLYVSLDRPVQSTMDYAVPATGADLALTYGYDGKGVTVAVLDSGIADHPDLGGGAKDGSRVIYRESMIPEVRGNSNRDAYGHGTHVAGIVAGNGSHSSRIGAGAVRGIAPQASLVDLQVLDENGAGTDSRVIQALERVLELKDAYGIKVVNLSLGRPIMESYELDPLCRAVEAVWRAGLTVVVAAGNGGRDGFPGSEGYWTITSPGNDPYVITVGAMKTMATPGRGDDLVASYSSKGPSLIDQVVKPDLVAPGNRVTSLLSDKNSTLAGMFPASVVCNGDAHYLQLSGSSMAAAVVSGATALLLQKSPELTPDQIKIHLMKTSTKGFPGSSFATDELTGVVYRSQYDIFTIGAGDLDIVGALSDGSHPAGLALSPTAVREPSGDVRVVAGASTAWVQSFQGWLPSTWGTSVLFPGSSLPGAASAAWGNSAAWGDSAAWGASAPVGESTVTNFAFTVRGNSAAWGAITAPRPPTIPGEL